MKRPCFLVIDREYSGSISTRKLVIETAKFNVITAYSGQEALDTVQRFPAIDGVVLDAGIRDIPAPELVAEFKRLYPQLPVVAIGAPGSIHCPEAEHELASFDPRTLLALLEKLVPAETAEIEAHNELLAEPRRDVKD